MLQITEASSPSQIQQVRLIFQEYAEARNFDDALKDFDEESGRMFHLIGWGKMAESMHHHLGARNRIVVQGRLVNRPRTRNGVRFYRTEIRVSEFMVLRESEFRAQEVCLSPNSPT